MDEERELALKLACGCADRYVDPEETVARARLYLDFLTGTHDAEIINAARHLSDKVQKTG